MYSTYGPDGYISGVISGVSGVSVEEILAPGDSYVEGSYEPNADRVVNGAVVKAPPRPSPYHHYDKATSAWVQNNEALWIDVRAKRNQLLAASDWTQYADVSIPNKSEWATYRQALRDVTNQSDPLNIVWPVAP
jgi:hypothetical protein